MKTETKTKIENFLKELNNYKTDIDIVGCVDIEDINMEYPFNSIYEILQDNGAFNVEIIYYSNAIEYLKENDPSLCISLNIAKNFGFEYDDISSETLATLLYQENEIAKFYELADEIHDFFESIKNEIED